MELAGIDLFHRYEIWYAYKHNIYIGVFKVACCPVFSRSTNLESKLIEFFVFVNF